MGALVFVTNELNPFTPGGIGRVVHNMLKTMHSADRERTIVLLLGEEIQNQRFDALFPGARLIAVTPETYASESGVHYPPEHAISNGYWLGKSLQILRALRELSDAEPISYVEFPDWGGLGFATIQEKKLSGFLQGTTLAVRLHSTEAMLLTAEARPVGIETLILSDIERKCLRDCDLIVAQLECVADVTRDTLGFTREEWDSRVRLHAPPVLLDTRDPAQQDTVPNSRSPILFVSKLQRFKRPDVFARGVSAFMARNPSFQGDAFYCAHDSGDAYSQYIRSLIPASLRHRFHFLPKMSQTEREAMIANAIVVVPSDFESFCLAAYEAALLGARVVVNAADPAFGDGTPWRDGENCITFDGGHSGLATAIERCLALSQPMAATTPPSNPWPWTHGWEVEKPWAQLKKEPLVSIVLPHRDDGRALADSLATISDLDYDSLEIIVVDDASGEPYSRLLVDELGSRQSDRLSVIKRDTNIGRAAALNLAIAQTRGDYVLTLQSGDCIAPDFVKVAVGALENHVEFDVVVPQVGYYSDGEPFRTPSDARDFAAYDYFIGEAVLSGVIENKYSSPSALFRRSLFDRIRYDEAIAKHEEWSFYMRMCDMGIRTIVTPAVLVTSRLSSRVNDQSSMPEEERRYAYSDLMRTGAPQPLRSRMHFLALCTQRPQPSRPTEAEIAALQEKHLSDMAILHERLAAYEKSEVVFAALKFAQLMEFRAPFVLRLGKVFSRQMWHTYQMWRGRRPNQPDRRASA